VRLTVGLSSRSRVAAPLVIAPRVHGHGMEAQTRAPLQVHAGKKTQWSKMFRYLTDKKLKSVSPNEAQKLMKRGWVLIDTRPDNLYETSRAAGSKNASLYQPITGRSPMQVVRYALYKSMDVAPVESNPNFLEDAQTAMAKARGVIVACSEGGDMTPQFPSFPNGKTSRSLEAAYEMLESGVGKQPNFVHLEGGLNAWFRAGLPGEGEQWQYDARTPSEAKKADDADSFTKAGRQAAKDRSVKYSKPSGTLLQSGGNALDPFGTWSVLLKKNKTTDSE